MPHSRAGVPSSGSGGPSAPAIKPQTRTCYNDELTARTWALNSAVECHLHTVEVIGSNPIAPTNFSTVRSGDIGNRTFRRHRLHFWPEGVLQGLQGFFLQINIAEIVIHKTDQPDAVVDLLDTDGLARKGDAEVDLLVIEAKTSAVGDYDGPVVERVVRFGDASIRATGSRVDLGRAFHGKGLMGPFLIEFLQESVEFALLLQDVGTRR